MEKVEQVSRSKRLVAAIILGLLLLVLPVTSYMYMRNGFNWRKQAVAELGQYGKILPSILMHDNNQKFDRLKGSVCVVHVFPDAPDLTTEHQRIIGDCDKLVTQFGVLGDRTIRPDFRIAMIAENGSAEFRSHYQKLATIDYPTWVWTIGASQWRPLVERGYRKFCKEQGVSAAPHYYALTDTSGQIRRFYDAMDARQVGRMVEHIAMLLPNK